jgi:hypothetical protein
LPSSGRIVEGFSADGRGGETQLIHHPPA